MSSVTFAIVACALRASAPSFRVADRRHFDHLRHHGPQPAYEPRHRLDARLGPLHVLVGGTEEHDVQPAGVGAVALDEIVRPDDVPGALRHLHFPERDPAVREELRERLAKAEHAEVVQHLDPEPRVDHVHRRVVDTADVEVDRVPVVDGRALEGCAVVPGVAVAQEVPGRVDEGVHRLGLALPRPAAARTRHVHPVLGLRERRNALRLVVLDLGEHERQLVLGDGDDPARVAVDDRDRAAPVALAREAPVAQAVVDREAPTTFGREPLDDPAAALGRGEAVELTGVDEHLALRVLDVRPALVHLVRRADDVPDREIERRREVEIALVVGRNGHDRARPVVH